MLFIRKGVLDEAQRDNADHSLEEEEKGEHVVAALDHYAIDRIGVGYWVVDHNEDRAY